MDEDDVDETMDEADLLLEYIGDRLDEGHTDIATMLVALTMVLTSVIEAMKDGSRTLH